MSVKIGISLIAKHEGEQRTGWRRKRRLCRRACGNRHLLATTISASGP